MGVPLRRSPDTTTVPSARATAYREAPRRDSPIDRKRGRARLRPGGVRSTRASRIRRDARVSIARGSEHAKIVEARRRAQATRCYASRTSDMFRLHDGPRRPPRCAASRRYAINCSGVLRDTRAVRTPRGVQGRAEVVSTRRRARTGRRRKPRVVSSSARALLSRPLLSRAATTT